jgi:hypothetical protein
MDAIDRLTDARWDFDAYAVTQSLPSDLALFDRIRLREDSEVRLRVRAIAACENSEKDLELFVRAVRWLAEKERSFWPSSPHAAEQVRVTSEQFAIDLAGEGANVDSVGLAKIYSLADIERVSWGGSHGIDGDAGKWEMNLNRNIRPFRRVETLEDFLAIRERLDAGDESSADQGTSPPAVSVGIASGESLDDRPFVFIAMPFTSDWSEAVHESIERCCERVREDGVELRWRRADEIAEPGRITEQIRDALMSADVVIADISELNANVVYEVGYADANQTPLIVLNQDRKLSPFDLKDIRQIAYRPGKLGAAEEQLCRYLRAALGYPAAENAAPTRAPSDMRRV